MSGPASPEAAPPSPAPPSAQPALAGAAALCAGIGLARFAYVPLFPAMVAAGWVEGGEAGLLGACNLAGYLAGALGGRALGRRLGVPAALDAGMALVVLAFLACALHGPGPLWLLWLALWRGLAGLAGGILMALAGPAVQAVLPPGRRAAATGVVIAGIGVGVVLGALAVPLLVPRGLPLAWIGLAGLALPLWLAARRHWPDPPAAETMRLPAGQAAPPAPALLLAYLLSATGMVPPMVYLADLGVRGRGLEGTATALLWVLFGLGAMAGTLLGGRIARRLGGRRALTLWMGVQVAALGLCLLPGAAAVLLAAPFCGFAGVGASAVALAAAREIGGAAAGILWARATVLYALAQAVVGFALAALFHATGDSHAAVFGVGFTASLAALGVAWAGQRRGSPVP